MKRLLSTLLLCLCAVSGASAQWKWRDASGGVQYSDMPPPANVAEKDILERPSRRAPAAAAAASAPASAVAAEAASSPALSAGDPELEARRRAADQKAKADEAARVKAEQDKLRAMRGENCTAARNQLRTLESGIRISRVNSKGEREILDDRERSVEMQRARNAIANDCKG